LYFSPSVIRIIKLRRMRWAGHVAWMKERKKKINLNRLFIWISECDNEPWGSIQCLEVLWWPLKLCSATVSWKFRDQLSHKNWY
jgi:hypothetical protein